MYLFKGRETIILKVRFSFYFWEKLCVFSRFLNMNKIFNVWILNKIDNRILSVIDPIRVHVNLFSSPVGSESVSGWVLALSGQFWVDPTFQKKILYMFQMRNKRTTYFNIKKNYALIFICKNIKLTLHI